MPQSHNSGRSAGGRARADDEHRPAGLILAGGQSRRMGGDSKALTPLCGRPLLAHVIDRVAPQVDLLVLGVERVTPALAAFGLPQVPDARPGHRGPLFGVYAAMRHLAGRARWLLLAPCDAPFLPTDLGARLLACAASSASPAACVSWDDRLQPTFSIFHFDLLPDLERATMVEGQASLQGFLRAVGAARCAWPGAAPDGTQPPFFNINDAGALQQAQDWLADEPETAAC